MKRSILFKVQEFPHLSETFILAQIICAIECGYDVSILVKKLVDVEASKQHRLITKYNILDKIIIEDYGIPKNKLLRLLKASYLSILNFNYLFRLIRYLNHEKISLSILYKFHFFRQLNSFDIIHVQYGTNAKPLDLLKHIKLLSPKLIVSFHGHDLYFPINGIIPEEGYYEMLFCEADKLVANTPFLNSILLSCGAPLSKTTTIPVGVDNHYFTPGLNDNGRKEIRLITVGRLEAFKGQKNGIECIRQLLQKKYNVQYTIVGSGNELGHLENLIEKYNLTRHIKLVGNKSQKEIRDLLRIHHIFLMTSITDPNYGAESQGLVTAEAQACGLPVVGFDSGGVKYTIDDGNSGFVVPEGQVDLMTLEIEKLINDFSLLKQMGENAVTFVEKNYSKEKVKERWCQTYKEIIQ